MPSTNILLIVPPFIRLSTASLGLHLLQAYAKTKGFRVEIDYQSIKFAQFIGKPLYDSIAFSEDEQMLGERIFCQAAYGLPMLGLNAVNDLALFSEQILLENGQSVALDYRILQTLAQKANTFIDQIAQQTDGTKYDIIGCTSMFQQNTASIAILQKIKETYPHITTIIGGANCVGEQAKGIAGLSDKIDYVFSGESEESFVSFLENFEQGILPQSKVVKGVKVRNLDKMPPPVFEEYYEQLRQSDLSISSNNIHVPYETSRGCWWGEIYRCKFCSVHDLNYRQKSAHKVLDDLGTLMKNHVSNKINFTDDIMPNSSFKDFYPYLQSVIPHIRFYSSQKANINLEKMQILSKSGGYAFLPGLEALSTDLLKLMDKGVTAKQNIAMLRYAKSSMVYVFWCMLYGFPQDKAAYYQHYLKLIPLMHHLSPPRFYIKVQLQRYGVYVTHPQEHQVSNLKPLDIYNNILPENADIAALAYYFEAEYPSVVKEAPELIKQIEALVRDWQKQWLGNAGFRPMFQVDSIDSCTYRLLDTRNSQTTHPQKFITEKQAVTALVASPLSKITSDWDIDWGLEQKAGVIMDGWWVPLATASPSLLAAFENRYKQLPNEITHNSLSKKHKTSKIKAL